MKLTIVFAIFVSYIYLVGAPPVTQKAEKSDENAIDYEPNLEYHRYFKEIIEVLDTDKEFRDKLMKVDEVEIQSGKIAVELDFVNHNVRTKLDEIKRRELERLRHLATKQFELMNDIDTSHAKISQQTAHLDHNNPHTFEIEDLRKLLVKATDDLSKADEQRKEHFKEYEMQKEFDKQQKLKDMDEDHKKQYEQQIHDQAEKHKKHEPLHHPGSKDQLQQVWKEQDHMDSDNFDPHAFFLLHDVDSNGYWDEVEVKALFLKELDKMYENGAPEDDMWERREEMERMREHVFKEADRNRDGLISYEEFLIQTRRAEWEKDKGWKGLDEQQMYSPEEYHEYERRRVEEMQRLMDQGMMPPSYNGQYQPGQHPQGQYPPQYHPQPPPNFNQQHPQAQMQPPHNQQFAQGQPQHYQGQQPQYVQHQPQGQPQMQQVHPQQMQHSGQQVHHSGQQVHNSGQQVHNSGQQVHNSGQQVHNSGQQVHNSGQQVHNSGQQIHQGQQGYPQQMPQAQQGYPQQQQVPQQQDHPQPQQGYPQQQQVPQQQDHPQPAQQVHSQQVQSPERASQSQEHAPQKPHPQESVQQSAQKEQSHHLPSDSKEPHVESQQKH